MKTEELIKFADYAKEQYNIHIPLGLIKEYIKESQHPIEQEKPSEQPIAYEFHCVESGHCYVDYIRRTELEHSDETYIQKPLFYARQKHIPTDDLSDEDRLEPIQNALYATQRFSVDECTQISEGILDYLKDANFVIVRDK